MIILVPAHLGRFTWIVRPGLSHLGYVTWLSHLLVSPGLYQLHRLSWLYHLGSAGGLTWVVSAASSHLGSVGCLTWVLSAASSHLGSVGCLSWILIGIHGKSYASFPDGIVHSVKCCTTFQACNTSVQLRTVNIAVKWIFQQQKKWLLDFNFLGDLSL